jgi:hypothetical protein
MLLPLIFTFLFLLWLILLPSMALLTGNRVLHALMSVWVYVPVGAVLWFLIVLTA